jgi:hypothetical protein
MAHETNGRRFHAGALAVLAAVIAASFVAAAPARADHDGPSFSFFFGLPVPPPPPPVVVYGPPPVYYYEPAPRVVIRHGPYYYGPGYYVERRYPRYEGRHYRHYGRPHHHDYD